MPYDLTAERAKREAAAREAKFEPPEIVLGTSSVLLPVELPLEVFAPLRGVNVDFGLLARQALVMYRSKGTERMDAADLLLDIIAANPDLPAQCLAASRDVARALLGDDGYNALVASRPTLQDVAGLLGYIFESYGASLGESLTPSGSQQTGGQTSKPTSSGSTDSTPAPSSPRRKTRDSSVSAAS